MNLKKKPLKEKGFLCHVFEELIETIIHIQPRIEKGIEIEWFFKFW